MCAAMVEAFEFGSEAIKGAAQILNALKDRGIRKEYGRMLKRINDLHELIVSRRLMTPGDGVSRILETLILSWKESIDAARLVIGLAQVNWRRIR